MAIGLAVHGHRGDAEIPAGADHPDRDLATVGDQDLGEHGGMVTRRSPWEQRPAAGHCPADTAGEHD